VFGNTNQHMFLQMLQKVVSERVHVFDVNDDHNEIFETQDFKRKYPMKAYVTVMYGCDNFCSYCIVPYVRGRERSRQPDSIFTEIEQLAQDGCKEIMLLGQNVNSYGKDLKPAVSFSELISKISSIDGIERIRFMTSHPKDISIDLMNVIASNRKVCKHLHLPLQSGSTKVLFEMNRGYTKEQFVEIIKKLKSVVPGIALSTDIIVGFPGETEADFVETLDVLETCRFDAAYMFLYSARTGTPAAKREDQISEDVSMERFERLLKVQGRISLECNRPLLGSVQKVLVESQSKSKKLSLSGRTDSNKVVNFDGSNDLIGKIIDVNIDNVKTWSLNGTVTGGEK